MNKTTTTRPTLRRHPYRGILREVAKQLGKTPQSISNRITSGDPEILAIVTAKMRERERIVARFNAKAGGDA